MRKYLSLIAVLICTQTASAQDLSTEEQRLTIELRDCLYIADRLDDGVSDARTIAHASVQHCSSEFEALRPTLDERVFRAYHRDLAAGLVARNREIESSLETVVEESIDLLKSNAVETIALRVLNRRAGHD